MDVIKLTSNLTLYILLTVAVVQDFRHMKVSNRLILVGLALGTLFQVMQSGPIAIVRILPNIIFPVILLYLLFLMRCLGAGDIKLFSVVGAFVNFKDLKACIAAAFIVGAILALAKMLYRKNLMYRLFLLKCYAQEVAQGIIAPYCYKTQEDLLHFSLSILIGLAIVQSSRFFGIT